MTTTYELYTNENGTPKAVEGKAPAIIERVEALETDVTGLDTALAGKADTTYVDTELAKKQAKGDYATTSALTSGLAGKANSSHTHTKSQITDFPEIPDTSTLIPKTGDRGTLRGYETVTLLEGSVINKDSPDVMYGGSNIVVENGLDSTSWTKVLYDQLNYAVGGEPVATSSITLGNKWGWAGGTVPTLGGGIVVLHWNKNAGVASFISAKK